MPAEMGTVIGTITTHSKEYLDVRTGSGHFRWRSATTISLGGGGSDGYRMTVIAYGSTPFEMRQHVADGGGRAFLA